MGPSLPRHRASVLAVYAPSGADPNCMRGSHLPLVWSGKAMAGQWRVGSLHTHPAQRQAATSARRVPIARLMCRLRVYRLLRHTYPRLAFLRRMGPLRHHQTLPRKSASVWVHHRFIALLRTGMGTRQGQARCTGCLPGHPQVDMHISLPHQILRTEMALASPQAILMVLAKAA